MYSTFHAHNCTVVHSPQTRAVFAFVTGPVYGADTSFFQDHSFCFYDAIFLQYTKQYAPRGRG